jgi:predicted enzyme related to lactoylglutathione lyase
MFKDTKAFSSFAVNDLAKARKFYEEVLGLKTSDNKEGFYLNIGEGNKIFVYGKPNYAPASFTVLNFPVDDVEKTVDELTNKGVIFEQYTGQMQTDAKGIFKAMDMVVAWFTDPAGNVMSVMEMKP